MLIDRHMALLIGESAISLMQNWLATMYLNWSTLYSVRNIICGGLFYGKN